eukprot:TRINITY_DN6786_c0_g1_i1.p1 TRINITY_DN6786_c0_g1~~TRINITY_DN6786_c0_g1_i1.p1  ORF type:complete len:137 (+),score=21.95 TRINITY_DN6786_c0_g1_i1:552-962(+)
MFFHPEFIDKNYRNSIDQCIDNAIQSSPIDYRKKLYGNINLSGGSTLFPGFIERLQKNLDKIVYDRMSQFQVSEIKPQHQIKVNVAANPFQRYSVWQGGSMLAAGKNFSKVYHSRQEYYEKGPSIARYNAVFLQGP